MLSRREEGERAKILGVSMRHRDDRRAASSCSPWTAALEPAQQNGMHLHLPANVLRALTSPAHICTHPDCLLRCPVPSGSSAGSGAPSPRSGYGASSAHKPKSTLRCPRVVTSWASRSFHASTAFPISSSNITWVPGVAQTPRRFYQYHARQKTDRQTMNGQSMPQPVVDTQQKRIIINFPSALCLDNVPPTPLEPSVPPCQPASYPQRSLTPAGPVYPTTHRTLTLLLPFPYLPAKQSLLATSRDTALAICKLTSIPLHLLVAVLPE